MKNLYRSVLLRIVWLVMPLLLATGTANGTCSGQFINPVTDICWSCVLPVTIMGQNLDFTGAQDSETTLGGGISNYVCNCGQAAVGVPIGFWEPARMVDVTSKAYCMVGLGGVELGQSGMLSGDTSGYVGADSRNPIEEAFYHAHFYTNPVLTVLGLILDSACFENKGFDVAYITEADPTWVDGELANLLNPDAFLYGSLPAVAACTADCLAASAGLPISALHWCAGCYGQTYPLTGYESSHQAQLDTGSLMMQRMLAKLHRQSVTWSYYGDMGLCGGYIQPLMNKRQYKYSMTYPIPQTQKIAGKCCQPLGRTTLLWGSGMTPPIIGEDMNFMIFRKRDCCQNVYNVGE